MRGAWKVAGAVMATALGLGLVDSCSSGVNSGGDATACVPGQQVSCGCPGGAHGVQLCLTDGSGFGSCRCPDAGSGATGGGGSGTGAGAASGGGGSQPSGGGGVGPGGSGGSAGAGGSVASCAGEAFPSSLPDLPACSGDGTACDAGGGANSGTCFSSHCFLNCTNSCTPPFECVQIQSATVCSVLTSCGSRCDVAKAALCLAPATCITITGDTYGMCLPACVANACPYEAGSYTMACNVQAGSDWFCGFDCASVSCPAEYDCVTVNPGKRCEPKQS